MSDAELNSDSAANLLISASEEAQKVARNEGKVIQLNLALTWQPWLFMEMFGIMFAWHANQQL